MRRRIFNILAAISLVLCLATAGLWVRSYWRAGFLGYRFGETPASEQTDWIISYYQDDLVLTHEHYRPHYGSPPAAIQSGWITFDTFAQPLNSNFRVHGPGGFEFLGFGCGHRKYASGLAETWIFFPDWFLVLLLAIFPAWRIGGWKRRRRQYRLAHGLCPVCGYDLRATPDASGPLLERCPECGRTIRDEREMAEHP